MKKKIKLKKGPFIFVLIIVILLIVIISKSVLSDKSKIVGTWTTDGITIYEFKKNNTGKLKVSLSEYVFKYKLKKNIIYIDFESDKIEDSNYNYSFKDKKLILKNEKGEFTFTKK